MAKYTQTLTGTSYNTTDFSTSLKTAFDSLGWGTGKVDISGGYRYTGTDQTNSETTPLVVSTFQENFAGKNIINPNPDSRFYSGAYYLGMYLPGVSSFRLKYTVMSDTMANGTSVDTSNAYRQSYSYTFFSTRPDYQSEINDNNAVREFKTFPANSVVGTQYTTDWSTKEISSHTGVIFKHGTNGIYLRLDAVEYKVSQNKFAFQSPNLDSPTFESNTINYNGTLVSTITTYPIKESKVPILRLIRVGGLGNSNFFNSNNDSSLLSSSFLPLWNEAIFHYAEDITKFGTPLVVAAKDRIADASFGNDIILRVGSNPTFQGFFVNTQQGSLYNGAVWDTVDKVRSYPNSTPIYPSQRKCSISLMNTTLSYNDNLDYYSSNTVATGVWNEHFYTFKVKNQATFSGFYITDSWSYSQLDINNHNVEYTVHSATRQSDGSFKLGSPVFGKQTKNLAVTRTYVNENFLNFPDNTTLTAGYYVLVIRSNRAKNYYKSSGLNLDSSLINFKARDFEAVSHTNTFVNYVKEIFTGVRYIRSSSNGSNMNAGSHWVEIKALSSDGTNYAANKTVTIEEGSKESGYDTSVVTDNNSGDSGYYLSIANGAKGYASIVVDLGQVYADVTSIKIWRYYTDNRTYNNSKLEVSSDGVRWLRLDDGVGYAETSSGKEYTNIPAINSTFTVKLDYSYDNVATNSDGIVGSVTGSGNPMKAFAHLQVRLEQSSSPTPSQQLTSFAENWVSVAGKCEYYGSSAFRKESISKSQTGYFTFESRFMFGIDLQSQRAVLVSGGYGTLMQYPGEGSKDAGEAFRGYNTSGTRDIEFMNTTNKTDNGLRYHGTWANTSTGMAVRLRNTFIMPSTVPGIGVSYVTADGTEYVVVAYMYDNNSCGQLFRLTP